MNKHSDDGLFKVLITAKRHCCMHKDMYNKKKIYDKTEPDQNPNIISKWCVFDRVSMLYFTWDIDSGLLGPANRTVSTHLLAPVINAV